MHRPLQLFLVVLVVLSAAMNMTSAAKAFDEPTNKMRLDAIGDTKGLLKVEQAAFSPHLFTPIRTPIPGDWLVSQPEKGQSYAQFIRSSAPAPDDVRAVLYLVPLEKFNQDDPYVPSLELLKEYLHAFFQIDVIVRKPVDTKQMGFKSRFQQLTKKTQLYTPDILRFLSYNLPRDGFAMLAVTKTDLYPNPSWSYCFGQASLADRVGVWSFARFDPAFLKEERPPQVKKLILQRCLKTMAHETCHMFGIDHCIYFDCLVNGSNHLKEKDEIPMHLCPIDLRKLHHSLGFNLLSRYQALEKFYDKTGLQEESKWTQKQIDAITSAR